MVKEEPVLVAGPELAVSILATRRSIEITTFDSFSSAALSSYGDDDESDQEDELRYIPKKQQQFPKTSIKELKKLQRLTEECPTATDAEIRRFLAEHKTVTSASKKLSAYLDWRDLNAKALKAVGGGTSSCSMSTDDNSTIWSLCCRATVQRLSLNLSEELKLPRIIRMIGSDHSKDIGVDAQTDSEGNGVLLLLPAILDTKVASISTYALATSLYIDTILDRMDMKKMTLIVDVRPGRGWANPTPQKVLPYLQKISQIGANMFPERLAKAVAAPVPGMAVGLWNMARPLLDKKHVARVSLVSGSATGRSPLPHRQLEKFFPARVVEAMEKSRRQSFC